MPSRKAALSGLRLNAKSAALPTFSPIIAMRDMMPTLVRTVGPSGIATIIHVEATNCYVIVDIVSILRLIS